MRILRKIIKVTAKRALDFVDLTDEIMSCIEKYGIREGLICVFIKHTTAAIRINENEKGFKRDFKEFMQSLIPHNKYYRHNDLSIRTENLACSPGATECINGHSHIQQLFLGTSETIPIEKGKLVLGRWQRIFLIELDKPRPREVFLKILGI